MAGVVARTTYPRGALCACGIGDVGFVWGFLTRVSIGC